MDSEQFARVFGLGAEIRDALVKLAEDPVVLFDSGPPLCPHCERVNPVVAVSEREASGPLNEIVIQAVCMHCKKQFFAVPVMWACVKTVEEVREVMQERAEISNGQGS